MVVVSIVSWIEGLLASMRFSKVLHRYYSEATDLIVDSEPVVELMTALVVESGPPVTVEEANAVELAEELDPSVTVKEDAVELSEELDATVEDVEVEDAEDEDDAAGENFSYHHSSNTSDSVMVGRRTNSLTGGVAGVGKGRLCRLYVGATHVQDGRLNARRVRTADTLEISRIGLSTVGEGQSSFERSTFRFRVHT